MSSLNEDYWYNQWHLDYELHNMMGITNVSSLNKEEDHVSVYADTDSCDKDTIISTNNENIRIEDWYNKNASNGSAGETIKGHESVYTNDLILNYVGGEITFSKVKRIIRHKVSKPKWKLKTKTGRSILVTNDHSMIVFRDGKKIEIKPSNILLTDKILIVKNNIYR